MSTTPIFPEPNRGFRMWHISEIYTGPSGVGRYVPNVNDGVVDWATGTYRVIDVDNTTGLSTIIPANLNPTTGGVLAEDVLLGAGPGGISESYRLYINTETVPHTLAFDSRLRIYGQNAHHVKVFRGTDISENGHVISAIFNTSNVLISENIPLENIIIPGDQTPGVKTPIVASSIETLLENEPCTVVVYDVGGTVLSYYKLLVRVTNFIRSTDASKKYIVDIDLLSPFLSTSDNSVLEFPINLLIQSGHVRGRVTYSDGSQIILPVDGTKFKLHGMETYIASVLGQQTPLVMTYYMSADEYAFGDTSATPTRFISKPYTITTIAAQGVYSVKLFAVPRWTTTPTLQWTLDWYLYNLDRDEIFNATPYVEYGAMSAVFDGTNIGVAQELTVAVNIQDVSPSFNYFRHVQTLSITLLQLGNNTAATTGFFTIEYTPGNVYGQSIDAIGGISVTPAEFTLDVSNGETVLADWLDNTYYKVEPLYLPPGEAAPIEPTHFRLRIGNSWSREILVSDFDNLVDNITIEPVQGQTARLEFFKSTGLGDLELAVVPMTIRRP